MKKLVFVLLIGLFSLPLMPDANAQDKLKIWESVAEVATVVVDGVKDGCGNLREEDRLQWRCKNGTCGQVACISIRKKCLSDSDCKRGDDSTGGTQR